MAGDAKAFNRFFHAMLDVGVYLAPSAFERASCRQRTARPTLRRPSPPPIKFLRTGYIRNIGNKDYGFIFTRCIFYHGQRLYALPLHGGKEVAFAGRSNAGKSSAINTLANHVRLAYTSKTPGRTQHLNYFDLGDNASCGFARYGYAKVPTDVRAHWKAC